MDSIDMQSLWESYSKKLDAGLLLQQKNAEDITKIKVRSFLASMQPTKIFTLVCGLLWVFLLYGAILLFFSVASPFFLVSVGILAIINTLAIGVYVYQTLLIQQANIHEPILALQQKIARLETSTLWVTRILFLQFPAWTTFYLTANMLLNGPWYFLVIQIALTLGSLWLSVWMFRNIHPKNRDKKWFRLIFRGREWTPMLKAMELLDQLEEEKVA